jgi:hypothetical protein
MPDEFGTVNIRRGDRAREIEIIRQQYRRHRETLGSLAADAPTEHLAGEYNRLVQEIDLSLLKLDELNAVPPRTDPGKRALEPAAIIEAPEPERSAAPRIIAIVVAGLAVLAIIGWLMWRSDSDERPSTPVVTETTATEPPVTPAPQPIVRTPLTVEPRSHDYGTIRKGTRAARQFEVTNHTDRPLSLQVARSACRCLFYDYNATVPANGRETITVTIDAVRARAGILNETVTVTDKNNPGYETSFQVTASIQ